jgi:uncharacterized protein YyaL (SSP411 family)
MTPAAAPQDRRLRTASAVALLALGLVAAALAGAAGPRARGTPAAPRDTVGTLPGAPAFDPALRARLTRAAAAVDGSHPPRTRHRRTDGQPRYTNRLVLEHSPYLLQHAHNPVDWYPWGDEAFARALAEHRPVLLSIGYSTCHWCHVMEDESFEDEEIAAYLNANYVAIKVDREQRPDLDAAYMRAVLALTGNGGWPMTIWLTPARQPFFATTYIPPHDGERGMRVGLLTLLRELRAAFDEQPERVAQQAAAVTARVRALALPPAGEAVPGAAVLRRAFAEYASTFDDAHGGFGGAPKFPPPAALAFLLRYHRRTGDARALEMVTRTLEAMAAGGIHDQIGGGFHRYATDTAWQVPHFEKMLTDNAQLAIAYLEAYQATHRPEFAAVARDVLGYVAREMTAPDGAFYTATDADSGDTAAADPDGAGREGVFFVWTPAEIRAALAPASAQAVLAFYDVTPTGNFRGATVLHAPRPLADVARTLGTEPEHLGLVLAEARQVLYAQRAHRPPPAIDTKIVTAWNGLMISAFARGGAILGVPSYVERARAAAHAFLDDATAGHLHRSRTAGVAEEEGFLEDYADLAAGYLDLYDATFDVAWLRAALALHATMATRFRDPAGGGFFETAANVQPTLARLKPEDDLPLPSGNAVAAATLLRLAELTGDDALRRRAEDTVRALAPDLERAPTRAPRLLAVVDFLLDRPRAVVIVHPRAPRDARRIAVVRARFLPNHVLAVLRDDQIAAQTALMPMLADKGAQGGRSTAYVCTRGACRLPTSDPAALDAQLAEVTPLPRE